MKIKGKKFYSDEFVNEQKILLLEMSTENIDWNRMYLAIGGPRIEHDAYCIEEFASPEWSILDIGALPPYLESLLSAKGFKNLHVLDPRTELFEEYFKMRGITAINADLLNPLEDGLAEAFDLVCLNEVIEHLAGNMLQAVERAITMVKPGGFIYVTTPNLRSISGLVSLLRYKVGLASKPHDTVRQQYERAGSEYGYFGHIREYTEKEIITLIESYGLKHRKSYFLPRYYWECWSVRWAAKAEELFPTWALFGKYLFQKPEEPN